MTDNKASDLIEQAEALARATKRGTAEYSITKEGLHDDTRYA